MVISRISTVARAAQSSRVELLAALRDVIADEIDAGPPAREMSTLVRLLLVIVDEIREIESGESGGVVAVAAAVPDVPWQG